MSDEPVAEDQYNRILDRTIHEENVFYARLNFFLVFESVLLAAFVSINQQHVAWPALSWAMPALGTVISGLWWHAQARQRQHVHILGQRVNDELPEYQGKYCGQSSRVSASWLMAHGMPAIFLSVWVGVRIWLSAAT